MSEKFTPLTSCDYKPLSSLLPLRTPLTVTFCSTQKCNFFCEFCYRHNVDKLELSTESMPMNFLHKLADDIADFDDQIGVIDVCGSGEPLLLPDIARWIRLLKDTNNIKQLKMITNGTLLTPQKSEEVIASGLDLIVVSINGINDEHYSRVVHNKVNFNKLVENIEYLYKIKENCKLHIKCIGDYFSKEELDKFIEIFSPITDTIHIDNVINQWLNFDLPKPPHTKYEVSEKEGLNNRFGKDFMLQNKPMCNFPFYYMRIHTSGKVSSCATNWEDKMILGDSKKQSLKEIWHSKELNELQLKLLKQVNLPKDCGCCKYYEMMTVEDLTPFKDELIKKYTI